MGGTHEKKKISTVQCIQFFTQQMQQISFFSGLSFQSIGKLREPVITFCFTKEQFPILFK